MRNEDSGDGEYILTINRGSSSLKFALFRNDGTREICVAEGGVEPLVTHRARGFTLRKGRAACAWLRTRTAQNVQAATRTASCEEPEDALAVACELLTAGGFEPAAIVAHRIVHGGPEHSTPTIFDGALRSSLSAIVPLAPLHLPDGLLAMDQIADRRSGTARMAKALDAAILPGALQVACFDTAFHATLPEVARRLPIPERFREIRRYGFHGIAYEAVMDTLGVDAPARIVIAHLGSGSSLVAVENGRAIDTTMGFTPCGGIPMATRSGDLDPGVLVYLARTEGLDVDALEQLVTEESGLLAVGGSADMETLLARAPTDPHARAAVALFAYATRKAIGGFIAALGGIDLLVFTGGIGENSSAIRAEACEGLGPFGIVLDEGRNRANAPTISPLTAPCRVQVIPAAENRILAKHARAILAARRSI